MSRDSEREQEPVTITDKRRIDPATGAPRPSTGFSGGGSRAAGVPQAPDAEDVSVAAGAGGATPGREPEPHDAEPTLAEEALVAEGEVIDADVEGDEEATDPVQQELLERTADLQRLSAEYANYRRRVERDRQAVIDAAKAAVAGELLGVLDDLERARSHGDLDGPLKSVADKLSTALHNQGLTSFGAVGEPFDPAVHEAVSHDGTGGEPVVGIVMRQGYRFGERVLRPAMVGVTDAPDAGSGPVDDTVPGPSVTGTDQQ